MTDARSGSLFLLAVRRSATAAWLRRAGFRLVRALGNSRLVRPRPPRGRPSWLAGSRLLAPGARATLDAVRATARAVEAPPGRVGRGRHRPSPREAGAFLAAFGAALAGLPLAGLGPPILLAAAALGGALGLVALASPNDWALLAHGSHLLRRGQGWAGGRSR